MLTVSMRAVDDICGGLKIGKVLLLNKPTISNTLVHFRVIYIQTEQRKKLASLGTFTCTFKMIIGITLNSMSDNRSVF